MNKMHLVKAMEKYEGMISLKDILFSILYRWKVLLVIGLIGAVVLGGFKGIQTWRGTDQEIMAVKEQEYLEAKELYEEQKESIEENIVKIEEDIEEQSAYLETSLLINMDPTRVCEAYTKVIFQCEKERLSKEELSACYQAALMDNNRLSQIADSVGISADGLKELIWFYSDEGVLNLSVYYEDVEGAQRILNLFIDHVAEITNQLVKDMGDHTVSVMEMQRYINYSSDIANRQAAAHANLKNLEDSLLARQTELEALVEPVLVTTSASDIVVEGIIWAIIGAILGMVLAVVCIGVGFLFSNKVYSGDELKERFSLKLMGDIKLSDKKFDKITAWLRKREGRVQDADYDLLAANIANYIGGAKRVLLTGNVDTESMRTVADELASKLGAIQLVSCVNFRKNAGILNDLKAYDGVLLVEKCNVSRYSEITKDVEYIRDMKVDIVGCVVVDA